MEEYKNEEERTYYELYHLNKKLMTDNNFRKYIINAWAEWEGTESEKNIYCLIERVRKARDIFKRDAS